MAKCKIIAENEFKIYGLSTTEINRNFIKFGPKQVPKQLQDIEYQTGLKAFFQSSKGFGIKWGTQNRLYIPKKKLKLYKKLEVIIKFESDSTIHLSEME